MEMGKKSRGTRPARAEAAASSVPSASGDARPGETRGRIGTRAGDAAVLAVVEGARELWKKGHLQKAGREVVRGKTDLRSALRSLAKPARDLVDTAVKEHARVASEDREVGRQLVEALRNRRLETRARTMKRGGKSETVMRGVVSGPDGAPIPGLVVKGWRSGTRRSAPSGVDVTDAEGRYQLVLPNEELGSAKSINVSLEIGLGGDAVVHSPGRSFKVARGTATDHDLQLPAEDAGPARYAVSRRVELDVARVHEQNRHGALLAAETRQLEVLRDGLNALLGGRRRR